MSLLERLNKLQSVLENYFAAINEQSMGHPGLHAKPPEKPEALILYQQMEVLHIPVWDGGLMDQPYILMQEFAVVNNVKNLFEAIRIRQMEAGK